MDQLERKIIALTNEVEHKNKQIAELKHEVWKQRNTLVWQWWEAISGKNLSLSQRAKKIFIPALHQLPKGHVLHQKLKTYAEPKPIKFEIEPWEGPLVSVVIPMYNYGRYIDEAMESIFSQGITDRLEVIIVEGFSSDGTRELIQEKEQQQAWPNTTIFYQDQRTSIGENRLKGFELAQGKYIACLDADDKLAPGFLKQALEIIEISNYDVVYPSEIHNFGENYRVGDAQEFELDTMFTSHNLVFNLAVFRKSFWLAHNIGYSFSRDIFEDYDFWLRMASAGARFKLVPESKHFYRVHTSEIKSMTDERIKHQKEMDARTLAPYIGFVGSKAYKQAKENNRLVYIAINPKINL